MKVSLSTYVKYLLSHEGVSQVDRLLLLLTLMTAGLFKVLGKL